MTDAPIVFEQPAKPPVDTRLKGLVWVGDRAVQIRVVLEASGRVHGNIHAVEPAPVTVLEVPEALLEDA